MKHKILSSITTIAAGLLIGGLASAAQVPVLEFNSGDQQFFYGTNYATVGWSFTTNEAITVTALDAYDPTGDGYVQLYNGAGDVLASAYLTTSDVQQGSPTLFYTQALLDPVSLVAGTTYYITEDICGANSCPDDNDGLGTLFYGSVGGDLSVDPSITYDGGVAAAGAGQTPTTDGLVGDGLANAAFFGPNFDIASAAPEPSTLLMGLSASLLGLAALRRRRYL